MHCLTISLSLSCHVASLLPPINAFKGSIRLPARRSASWQGLSAMRAFQIGGGRWGIPGEISATAPYGI